MEPWKAGMETGMSCKAMNPWLFVTLFTQAPVNVGLKFYPKPRLGPTPCRLISWTCCWVLGLERGGWVGPCVCWCGSSEASTHFGSSLPNCCCFSNSSVLLLKSGSELVLWPMKEELGTQQPGLHVVLAAPGLGYCKTKGQQMLCEMLEIYRP